MIRNNRVLTAFAYVVLLGTFNAVVFLLNPIMTPTFWIGYGFATAAFVIKIVSFFISFKGPAFERTVLGRLPIVVMSSLYLYLALIIGIILMVFPFIPLRLALVAEIIALALFLTATAIVLIGRNLLTDDGVPVQPRKKPIFVDQLASDVFAIKTRAIDPNMQSMLDELLQRVQYSDPNTNSSLLIVEGKIKNKVKNLAMCVERNNTPMAAEAIEEIKVLLTERDELSKTL